MPAVRNIQAATVQGRVQRAQFLSSRPVINAGFLSDTVPQPRVDMVVDRPFIVAIRESIDGDLLFLGRVTSIAP